MDTETLAELRDLASAYFWPHFRAAGDMSPETGIKVVTNAQGAWVEDGDAKKWFDTLSGMWLVNAGHGRREIADAVYQQMLDISYSPGGTVSPSTIRLAAKLASLSPDKESRVYFVSGGSEAVETALKMAKKYHRNNGEPGRYKVISRRGSYHGATHACMSLGGGGVAMPADYGPLMPGNVHVQGPDQFRCTYCRDKGPSTGSGQACNLECARDIDRAIQFEGPSTVAAVIGEPISVASGVHIPHPEYWPSVREICDRHGVLMICDEVITGFGRTGRMFATEHWGVKPDIFTVAKALTSGYLPIGAAIASKAVADNFMGDDEKMFRHLITFGGNPASCAAGLANLVIFEKERLVQNAAEMGDYLYGRLQDLYKHPIVGQVRGGMGLLCAVEVTQDRETRAKFPPETGLRKKMEAALTRHGLLGRGGDMIYIAPPLVVTRSEVDYLVTQVDGVLADLQEELEG